jgi:hypothetical protein
MANQNLMAIAWMKFSILYSLLRFFRPPLKPAIEVKSSENIALLLVFVNICWLVKLNPTLSNFIIAIAKVGIVGNAKCAIGSIGRSSTKLWLEGGPDLAVEILSPGNTVAEIHDKLVEYFENGARLVWVIHPQEQYVLVSRSSQEPDRLLKSTYSLDGEEIVPGFTLPIAEFFQQLAFSGKCDQ